MKQKGWNRPRKIVASTPLVCRVCLPAENGAFSTFVYQIITIKKIFYDYAITYTQHPE